MKHSLRKNPRLAAVNTLGKILDKKLNMSDADESGSLIDSRDRALARHLVYGVVRWLDSLQFLSSQLIDRPLKSRDRDISRLILIGLSQLWHDSTAEHAVIHETAECARSLGKPWAVGLVNAVLRRFQREQQALLASLDQRPERFAHPQWLLQSLQKDWPDHWQNIVKANNLAAPLWLRINRSKATHTEAIDPLRNKAFTVADHRFAADAIRISPAAAVNDIPGFSDGVLSVQDAAAQLAVDLLDLQAEHHVLDACAAPGGKTCHILERFPEIALTAVDLNHSRLALVKENLERLGFGERAGLKLLAADASQVTDWWDGCPFDRILLDAPCTATGVIRRHPEIKYLRSPEQLQEAIRVQALLLRQLWPLLKPGGILVYATCSVLIDENRGQINQFLSHELSADAEAMLATWGHDQGVGRQILPGEEEMDGFYYACLRKKR